MGHSFRRAGQLAIAALFMLTMLLAGTADAHIASNYGGNHTFSKTANGLWASAEDTVSDGHCTYAGAWDGTKWFEGPRSCGSKKWQWHDTNNSTGSGFGYGCITGHWECKFKANWA